MKTVCSAMRSITVEPVLFLFMVGSFMQYTAFQSLIYSKVCSSLYNELVCDGLHLPQYHRQQERVQADSSYWLLAANLAVTVPALVSALYTGSWSDTFSRKLPLLLPPIGQVLAALVYTFMAVFSSAPVGLVVLANFLAGCMGGFTTCIMAVMAYVSGASSAERRTSRLMMLEAMTFLGGFVGPFVGSALHQRLGSAWTFCSMIVINTVIVLYTVAAVPELEVEQVAATAGSSTPAAAQMFDLRRVRDTIMTAFKRREENRRMCICWLLVIALVIMLNTSGEMNVTYLYIKDAPINGSDLLYSTYFSIKYALAVLALLVFLPLTRRFVHLRDVDVCALGALMKTTGLVWLSFSTSSGMLFVTPPLMMFSACCLPPVRSLLSKLVPNHEHGRIMAVLNLLENLCTLLGSLLYNGVYPATERHMHGLVFLLGAATMALPLLLLFLLQRRLSQLTVDSVHQSDTAADMTENNIVTS